MSQFGSVGQLGVDIFARLGKLDKGLKEAESKTLRAGKNIEDKLEKQGIGGVAKTALKAFAAFSLIEAGIKSATAITAVFKGEWESAAASIKSLPLGIGALATGLDGLLREVTGFNQELKEQEELQKRANRQLELAAKLSKQRLDSQRALNDVLRQGQTIGLTGFRKEFEALAFGAADRERQLRDQLRTTQDPEGRRNLESAIAAVGVNFERGAQALLNNINARLEESAGLGRFGEQINTRFQVPGGVGLPVKSPEVSVLEEMRDLISTAIVGGGLKPVTELN